MALDQAALLGLLKETTDRDIADRIRGAAGLIDAKAAAVIWTGMFERSAEHTT